VPGAVITVRLVLPPASAQVTPENDVVVFEPPGFVTIGAGCLGSNGTPTLLLSSPPALGSNYTLNV
jgi:hypothetical protein